MLKGDVERPMLHKVLKIYDNDIRARKKIASPSARLIRLAPYEITVPGSLLLTAVHVCWDGIDWFAWTFPRLKPPE